MSLIEHLPNIISESVKPLEHIDGIKIIQVDGLHGTPGNNGGDGGSPASDNLADQMVGSALRYRSQAPLIDSLMNEIGIDGGNLAGLTAALKDKKTPPKDEK